MSSSGGITTLLTTPVFTSVGVTSGFIYKAGTAGTVSLNPRGKTTNSGRLTVNTGGTVTVTSLTSPTHVGVTGTANFRIGTGGSYQTATGATATTPAPTTGVAFTPNATKNTWLNIITTGTGAFKLSFGPSTGTEHVLYTFATVGATSYQIPTVPNGWKVVITSAHIGTVLVVTK